MAGWQGELTRAKGEETISIPITDFEVWLFPLVYYYYCSKTRVPLLAHSPLSPNLFSFNPLPYISLFQSFLFVFFFSFFTLVFIFFFSFQKIFAYPIILTLQFSLIVLLGFFLFQYEYISVEANLHKSSCTECGFKSNKPWCLLCIFNSNKHKANLLLPFLP